MLRIIRYVAILGTIAALAVGGVERATQYVSDRQTADSTELHRVLGDPYVWQDSPDHPTDTIYKGRPFYVHNKYIRSQTCHVMVTNLWIERDTKIAHHHSIFSNWFPAGTYEFNEYFEIPDQLPVGWWHITKKTVNFCNGQTFYTVNYDIVVHILDQGKK